jgi:hypothetical protein
MTVKTFFAKYWVVVLMFATIGAMQFFPTTTKVPSSTNQTSTYQSCYNPTVDFQVAMYKKQYPNLSEKEIRFTVCK